MADSITSQNNYSSPETKQCHRFPFVLLKLQNFHKFQSLLYRVRQKELPDLGGA